MYYRSVNRGVTLTTPGRYTILLVLALGIIAIASGYNAIYLALSMGFSTLIISGLLSEKVMKHYELQSLAETTAEPHTPFSLRFRATNKHRRLVIYGIENLLFTEIPPFGLLHGRVDALMQATVLNLAASSTRDWSGTCVGLPRGLYREFVIVQRTFFPFGLLAKFKLSVLPARVSIPPRLDEQLAAELRQEIRGRIAGNDEPREFHSHRPYTTRDSLRHVDWKKSAGMESKGWVLKQYESVGEDFGLIIAISWTALATSHEESTYEEGLSRVRTACEVGREAGLSVALEIAGGRFFVGFESAFRALVEAPPFRNRHQGLDPTHLSGRPAGAYLRVCLDGGRRHWDSDTPHLGAAKEGG